IGCFTFWDWMRPAATQNEELAKGKDEKVGEGLGYTLLPENDASDSQLEISNFATPDSTSNNGASAIPDQTFDVGDTTRNDDVKLEMQAQEGGHPDASEPLPGSTPESAASVSEELGPLEDVTTLSALMKLGGAEIEGENPVSSASGPQMQRPGMGR